ncbi:MAG: hypothetical protein HFE63_08820 [Clostridiales bacterium]|nr:hypothetical protein [Clostridiales bacterium]
MRIKQLLAGVLTIVLASVFCSCGASEPSSLSIENGTWYITDKPVTEKVSVDNIPELTETELIETEPYTGTEATFESESESITETAKPIFEETTGVPETSAEDTTSMPVIEIPETTVPVTTQAPITTTVPETTSTTTTTAESVESNRQTDVVYWVENGEVWHTRVNCPSLSRSKNIRSGTLAEAMNVGKARVCKRCSG